jgi:hypothetical protein
MIVTYDQDTGAVDIYRTDGAATAVDFVGNWFFMPPGDGPPVVITAEVFGQVFFAHADLTVSSRAQTFVYDPLGLAETGLILFGLEADLDETGVNPVKFSGVVRHLDYLFGWGFGNISQDRPELVRASLPGQPWRFNSEHYFVVGDRRDPVKTCVPFSSTLGVWKKTETWEIFGYDRATFGQRRIDKEYGCIGSRLATNVGGAVYFWSHIGPRYNFGGGPSQDAAQPLDVFGWEPASLITQGTEEYAFAGFIRDVRAVFFAYNKRLYVLFLRGGLANAKWCYWELGQNVWCAGNLYPGGLGAVTAPTGHPECTGIVRSADGTYMDVSWDNVGLTGDEIVELWYRSIASAAPTLKKDTNSDGIADGYTKVEDGDHTVTFAVNEFTGQQIAVTNAGTSDRNESGVEYVIPGVVEGAEVSVRVSRLLGGTGHMYWGFEFRNALDAVLETHDLDNLTTSTGTETIAATAPAGTDNVRIFLLAVTDDSAETITCNYYNIVAQFPQAAGVWLIRTTPATGSNQTLRVSGLSPSSDYEVALRYRRGPFVTAGYEGSDPTLWPDVSKCSEQASGEDPGALNPPTFRTTWFRLGVGDVDGAECNQLAVTATEAASIEVWRKLSGDPDFTFFVQLDAYQGEPVAPGIEYFINDCLLGGEGETSVEYQVRHRILSTTKESDWAGPQSQWAGPWPPPGETTDPIPITAFTITGTVDTIYVSMSSRWYNELANDALKAVEIEIWGSNLTTGGGYFLVATVPADDGVAWDEPTFPPDPTTFGTTYTHSGLTTTHQWKYKARVKQTYLGSIDYSEYSGETLTVTVL